ncbi:MAG: glycosyltransferase family 39 protein [Kiritimatiellae bacterium]|nr:glycosyltransferase family 39 protein [Kiritimatiellia bacterium]MDD4735413.1 glycosyltransferase family 39 protein [Kiritimatiellia bacterium]
MGSLLIRLCAAWSWSQTPFWLIPVADEKIYHDWASLLATGQYNPQAIYEFSPLPAYFFALVYRIVGISPFAVRLTNILLGSITCLLIAKISRKLSGRRVALFASVLAASYLPFIFYSVTRMKTSLSVLLFALFVFCLLNALRNGRYRWFLLLGLTTALATQTRGNYLLLLPVGLLAAFKSGNDRRSKASIGWVNRTVLFIAGALIVFAPVTVRNAQISHRVVLSTTQGGFNFYLGNHHLYEAPGSRPTQFAMPDPYVQGTQFTIEANRRNKNIRSALDASSYWYRATLEEIISNPTVSLKKTGRKLLSIFNRYDACDHFNLDYLRPYIPRFFSIPFPSFAWIFPLGAVGMLLSLKQREFRWLLLTGGAYATTLVLFFTNGRYRLPLAVILIPCAAAGLSFLVSAIKKHRVKSILRYFACFILFLSLSCIPHKGTNDFSAYRVNHGVVLDIAGNKTEAKRIWIDAVQQGGDFAPSACVELAKESCRQGQLGQAEHYLSLIPDTSFAYARKLALQGQIRVIHHRYGEAASLLRQSLAINSADLPVRELLIGILQQTSTQEALKERETQELIRSFYRGF